MGSTIEKDSIQNQMKYNSTQVLLLICGNLFHFWFILSAPVRNHSLPLQGFFPIRALKHYSRKKDDNDGKNKVTDIKPVTWDQNTQKHMQSPGAEGDSDLKDNFIQTEKIIEITPKFFSLGGY